MKKVELLFPELCNIYGESYNIEYLKRCSKDIDVIYTNHKEVEAPIWYIWDALLKESRNRL